MADLFGNISPFDRDFCQSPAIDIKVVEQRFIAAIVNATTKDDCKTFKEKLKKNLDGALKHETEIRKAGGEWLQEYACDNPTCFRDYAAYLKQAKKFAYVETNFFRMFCNTGKHGRKLRDADWNPIHHDLHTHSPICNPNYTTSLYTLKECGGEGLTQTFNLYNSIIACFVRTYQYALAMDLYAQSLRSNPVEARIILSDCIEKALKELKIADTNNIEESWIDFAKNKIDKQMLSNIYNKTIMELAPAFYHLVTTGDFPWFAILIKDKENHQGNLTEIECDIFKSIEDPSLRERTALEARKLIANFGKLKGTIYETGEKGRKDKTLSDGETITFITEYWEPEFKFQYSMKKMIKEYFCKLRHQEKEVERLYKAYDHAKNHMSNCEKKKEAFNKKAKEILQA